jgi:hypothetical protein
MKRCFFVIFICLGLPVHLYGLTLETESKFTTVSSSIKGGNTSFGRFPSDNGYGILAWVENKPAKGEADRECLFYLLKTDVKEEQGKLYAMVAQQKLLLAEKRWYGWKTAEGVKIRHRIKKDPHPWLEVWVEVEADPVQ